MPAPATDYRAIPGRRYEIDRAWPAAKVGVNLQGGVYIKSGHTTGKGIEDDYEKANLLKALGWTVFDFTTGMLERDPIACINLVREAVDAIPFVDLPTKQET